METDQVDLFIRQWNRERPDLDPSGLSIVSRVLILGKLLEQSADRALARFELTLWQFDVLAALRRAGAPFMLNPKQLMQLVTLSSGAMTNRVDRLEELGLVTRLPDPDDRRGVLIALTPEGRKVVERVIEVRLDDARKNISKLGASDRKRLTTLLRELLNAVSAQTNQPFTNWEAMSAPARPEAPRVRQRRSRTKRTSEVR